MTTTPFTMDMRCPNCDEEVPVTITPSGHERDSTGDYYECTICNYWATGHSCDSDNWNEPIHERL